MKEKISLFCDVDKEAVIEARDTETIYEVPLIFEQEGLGTWNNLWFGGHHLPGYGLLFPLLASVVGVRVVGALGVVVSAALFSRTFQHGSACR